MADAATDRLSTGVAGLDEVDDRNVGVPARRIVRYQLREQSFGLIEKRRR